MFRSKKGSNPSSEPAAETAAAVEAVLPQPEVAKPEPRRNVPFPAARPLPHTAFPMDISRRSSELAQIAGRGGDAAQAASGRDKSLAIGRDVDMRGEVSVCDRLIVDGSAHLTVSGARLLQIGASGLFTGGADVAEADIAGRFDGDLTVRERLTIRASGQVRGRVRYGQIVIEAGGELTGDVAAVDQGGASAVVDGAAGGAASPVTPFADMKLAAPAD
ncbi:MAG: polymer-forming cytoskeletal protein [Rhodospirillales bacterium]|jgi:cytoskeletal protein CcmA (bactofilin family)|nr:polymer-forming cytoskeletal protein [Rhodospirillales bacterium]